MILRTDHAEFDCRPEHRNTPITLYDGSTLWSEPHEDPARYTAEQIDAYRANAARVGLADLYEMSLFHDLAHAVAAEHHGWKASLSLWVGAHPDARIPAGIIPWEDEQVMRLQRGAALGPPGALLGPAYRLYELMEAFRREEGGDG